MAAIAIRVGNTVGVVVTFLSFVGCVIQICSGLCGKWCNCTSYVLAIFVTTIYACQKYCGSRACFVKSLFEF